jgi:hypothetical protein
MPPVEVHRKHAGKATPDPVREDVQPGSRERNEDYLPHAERLSGILKISDRAVIEEIAESDLLA